jgi:MFS family permease
VLSYASVAEYFPKELTGRANGALNTFHFGWAFVLQYAIGLILQQWPSQDGHYPAIAYQVAFGFNVGLQIAALAWFELAWIAAARIPFRPFPRPNWRENTYTEGNSQIIIGKQNYLLRADGLLMPAKKDQSPPDLRYFKQPQR